MEIKSPFSKAGMTVEEACKTKTFFLEKLGDETVRLKRNHDYYLQIQGQLYSSDLDLQGIILTVYFGEDKPLFLENIYSDNTCSCAFLPKIDFFYRRALFPELLILPNECRGESFSTSMVGGNHLATIAAPELV